MMFLTELSFLEMFIFSAFQWNEFTNMIWTIFSYFLDSDGANSPITLSKCFFSYHVLPTAWFLQGLTLIAVQLMIESLQNPCPVYYLLQEIVILWREDQLYSLKWTISLALKLMSLLWSTYRYHLTSVI